MLYLYAVFDWRTVSVVFADTGVIPGGRHLVTGQCISCLSGNHHLVCQPFLDLARKGPGYHVFNGLMSLYSVALVSCSWAD